MDAVLAVGRLPSSELWRWHAHPKDRSYVGIAAILALITAAEVCTFYLEDELGSVLIPALLVMMVVKFAMVAGWFMHLRFDSNIFTRLFVSGIVLAVSVYIAMLATFQFFSKQGEPTPVIRWQETQEQPQ